jgi:hypothetical protein
LSITAGGVEGNRDVMRAADAPLIIMRMIFDEVADAPVTSVPNLLSYWL